MISSQEYRDQPADVIKVDPNIILAIHHLKNSLKFTVDCRHVYGHQDGKNKKKQDEKRDEEEEDFNFTKESESSILGPEDLVTDMF